jgi:hypothetical protein
MMRTPVRSTWGCSLDFQLSVRAGPWQGTLGRRCRGCLLHIIHRAFQCFGVGSTLGGRVRNAGEKGSTLHMSLDIHVFMYYIPIVPVHYPTIPNIRSISYNQTGIKRPKSYTQTPSRTPRLIYEMPLILRNVIPPHPLEPTPPRPSSAIFPLTSRLLPGVPRSESSNS